VSDSTNTRTCSCCGQPIKPGHPRHYPQLHDMSWLRDRYEHARGLEEIAIEIGCSQQAVRLAMRRLGIPRRPRGGQRRTARVLVTGSEAA
jgi:nitroreductase